MCLKDLKGHWQPDGQFKIVMVRQQYERLKRSARLLHIPCEYSFGEYHGAIDQLVGALANPERDMWARTTLFVTDGHWGEIQCRIWLLLRITKRKRRRSPFGWECVHGDEVAMWPYRRA